MKQRLQHLVDRLDGLGRRDRMALLGGVIAVLIGIELTIIMPMADKRVLMQKAMQDEVESQAQTLQATRAAQSQQISAARARMAELDRDLSELGLRNASHAPLAPFLITLGRQGVELAGVRALSPETLTFAATDPDAASAPESGGTPTTGATLYRHRVEVVMQGTVQSLGAVLGKLETQIKPLRIERVRVAPNEAGFLQATVVLTTITEERTWAAF